MARQTLSAIDVNTDEAVLLLRLAGIEEFGSDVLALHRNESYLQLTGLVRG